MIHSERVAHAWLLFFGREYIFDRAVTGGRSWFRWRVSLPDVWNSLKESTYKRIGSVKIAVVASISKLTMIFDNLNIKRMLQMLLWQSAAPKMAVV